MRLLLSRLGLGAAPRVQDAASLGGYLTSRAAFVAQRVTVEYCRARAGIGWHQLMAEADFALALERCRWEAFGAVYPDIAETCQILLRTADAPRAAVGAGLAAVAGEALAAYPLPGYRNGWDDIVAALPARLERALLAAPRAVHSLGGPTVTEILVHIPFHPRLKNADRDILENGLRLALCGVYAELERRADAAALSGELVRLGQAAAV